MGRRATDKDASLGGGRRRAGRRRRMAFGGWAGDGGFDDDVGLVRCFRICCCFYDGAAPRKIIVLQGGGYGWGDGKVVGGWSGGDEGDFCLGDRQAAGGFVDGGRVCSELTASRLFLL